VLDPEGLAREAVPGHGKPLARLVARGPGHSTYRVMRDGQSYAMRLPLMPPAANPAANPADTLVPWDFRVFTAAAAAHLGPAIRHADPVSGILVTEWVRGRTWTAASARNPAQTSRIALLVQRIQALAVPPPHRAVRPADWIRCYRAVPRRVEVPTRAGESEWPGSAERHLAALAALPSHADVLCHSDLHRLNLIDSAAGLTVLDWEYAHFSDPYWDLAGWLSANDLAQPDHRPLLEAYLGRAPRAEHLQRLLVLTWLYDYVCLLWSDANGDLHADAAAARRARILAARLSAAA
jgi:thiamine kinase-like enzyme